MQGMVWGEPERGSAQNGIWKCDGDDSSHGHWQYQFSLASLAAVSSLVSVAILSL